MKNLFPLKAEDCCEQVNFSLPDFLLYDLVTKPTLFFLQPLNKADTLLHFPKKHVGGTARCLAGKNKAEQFGD